MLMSVITMKTTGIFRYFFLSCQVKKAQGLVWIVRHIGTVCRSQLNSCVNCPVSWLSAIEFWIIGKYWTSLNHFRFFCICHMFFTGRALPYIPSYPLIGSQTRFEVGLAKRHGNLHVRGYSPLLWRLRGNTSICRCKVHFVFEMWRRIPYWKI